MAESFSDVGKAAAGGALDASLEYIKGPQGRKILLHISTDNIEVAERLCKLAGYVVLGIGAITLGTLLGYEYLAPVIKHVIKAALGGERDDQDVQEIRPGSLHVLLHCLTNKRFLEVLEDFESGKIKERLQKQFSHAGIEVKGLKIEIENMEEVNEIKASINKRNRIRSLVQPHIQMGGIRGLTTYVGTLPFGEGKIWESFDLQDTNLVIDGCGLYYYIYALCKLNIKFGGEYSQLQEKIKEFFDKLRSNNVIPYVVFDGIMTRDQKKLRTHIERNTQRIKRMKNLWSSNGHGMVLPRLTQLAVVQVLQEIKVPYAVADL